MPSSSEAAGAQPRAAAARLDARIVTERISLDEALAAMPPLPERDAALVRALVFGARRWHHRLEWQIDKLLTRPLKTRDAELAALLRVGLFQLEWLRVPDHAAVAATVGAASLLGLERAKGLVNAVLRRYLREREALARAQAGVPEALYSHPAWIIETLRHDWPDDWQALLEAGNAQPPMWLRVNLARTTRDAYVARLAAEGIAASPPPSPGPAPASGESAWPSASPALPAAVLLAEPCPVSRLPGYAEGLVSVQDAAAQLAAGLLDLAPGLRVLDACAAPGGKTAHMLERCPELAEVLAVDVDPARLETVRENLERLGLAARLLAADAADPGAWWDGRPFDRILLDAPCSALGVIRRHPDIKILRRPEDVGRSALRQAALLEAVWPLLAEGGRLVYATCTLTRRENAAQIEAFLAAHADARRAAGPGPAELCIRTGEANTDGFYYACLQKQETPPPARVVPRIH